MKEHISGITIYYIPFIWILHISAVSCISLKSNYLGNSVGYVSVDTIRYSQLKSFEIQRHNVDKQADSILQIITVKRNHQKPLTAKEVNLLYTYFGQQLNFDRIMCQILKTGNINDDSLNPIREYAALSLLRSADLYNKSYQKNIFVRRTLNRGDIGNNIPQGILRKSRFFLYSLSLRKKILNSRSGILLTSFANLKNHLPKSNLATEVLLRIYQNNDRLNNFFYKTFEFLGRHFFSRENKPENNPVISERSRIASLLLSEVQPFDIILEKSGNILANMFIPGYFGHACIWFGSEAIKEKKNIQNRNSLRIRSVCTIFDKVMAESVTPGTRLCSMKDISDGKTYIILRYKNISAEQKKTVIDNVRKQIDKSYDYNFNIESSDKINCTELVYLAYDFINWKQRRYLCRYTLFPDDILWSALDDKCLEIKALVQDGKLIRNPDPGAILSLIRR